MEKTLDSYHDAVAKGQYAIYRLDNGVRVDYEIGDKSKGAESLPKQMDQARVMKSCLSTPTSCRRPTRPSCRSGICRTRKPGCT